MTYTSKKVFHLSQYYNHNRNYRQACPERSLWISLSRGAGKSVFFLLNRKICPEKYRRSSEAILCLAVDFS